MGLYVNDQSWHFAEIEAWLETGLFYVRSIWQRTVVPPSLFCPRTNQGASTTRRTTFFYSGQLPAIF
jgi:hypothetical protein